MPTEKDHPQAARCRAMAAASKSEDLRAYWLKMEQFWLTREKPATDKAIKVARQPAPAIA